MAARATASDIAQLLADAEIRAREEGTSCFGIILTSITRTTNLC